MDSAGDVVGQKGSTKHSINTFARQDFVFGADQIDIPIVIENTSNFTNSTNTTSTDVATGAKITFDTSLDTGSKLAVELILFSGAGEVGTATEKWSVQPGDMKFNFNMTEWAWCDPCNDGTGAYVDFDIEIKGSDDSPEEKEGRNNTFALGSGATLDLSNQILMDGNWTAMPAGYPKVETKGGKIIYTFRIPKFDVDAMYDPIVSFDADFDSSAGRTIVVTISILFSALLSFLFI